MYVSGVLAAVFLLLFFLGLRRADCPFYYKWVGKNGPFYVYIFHMAVAVALSKFLSFANLMQKCTAVLLVSFALYEACYLVSLLCKRKKT